MSLIKTSITTSSSISHVLLINLMSLKKKKKGMQKFTKCYRFSQGAFSLARRERKEVPTEFWTSKTLFERYFQLDRSRLLTTFFFHKASDLKRFVSTHFFRQVLNIHTKSSQMLYSSFVFIITLGSQRGRRNDNPEKDSEWEKK